MEIICRLSHVAFLFKYIRLFLPYNHKKKIELSSHNALPFHLLLEHLKAMQEKKRFLPSLAPSLWVLWNLPWSGWDWKDACNSEQPLDRVRRLGAHRQPVPVNQTETTCCSKPFQIVAESKVIAQCERDNSLGSLAVYGNPLQPILTCS